MNGMEMSQAQSVGNQVRRQRKARDLTQEQLAEQAGVAPGTVNRIENGRPVRNGNLTAVLDALDIELRVETPEPGSEGDRVIAFAHDLVEKWLGPMAPDLRQAEVNEFVKWVVSGPHAGK